MNKCVIVRGGGDIATGTIYKLVKSGFQVLVLEVEKPSAIRRNVAFCQAVYEQKFTVEDMTCVLVSSIEEAKKVMSKNQVAMMIDPSGEMISKIEHIALVDAILAKKNLGTTIDMAPITIGLGPGFCAGKDVHVVVETMRGHNLGRLIYQGYALPNTGVPGNIKGFILLVKVFVTMSKRLQISLIKEKLLRILMRHPCMRACQAYLED